MATQRGSARASASRRPRAPRKPTKAREFEEAAARLNITVERVLKEYARIAFADLGHLIKWGPDGVTIVGSEEIEGGDRAAVSEITGDAEGKGPVRVKMHNKKAALDAIARHLGMFPPPRRHDEVTPEPAEDPLEEIERRLARLAASLSEDAAAAPAVAGGAADPEV